MEIDTVLSSIAFDEKAPCRVRLGVYVAGWSKYRIMATRTYSAQRKRTQKTDRTVMKGENETETS